MYENEIKQWSVEFTLFINRRFGGIFRANAGEDLLHALLL